MSRFPWRDTSEDIAGQSNSQWETPAGAQAKADKALQEAKQYTDEKNQDFTDHINNKTIHVTQADKDNWNSKAPGNHTHPNATQTQAGFESPEDKRKLDGIAAGAEVNQNAFSKVNDVEAQSKTDTVTLKGGTGITVSTNKTTKEVTITATGEAIPGPHGSSHDHDGADPIPELVDIRERLEYTESKELTLQPGVQLVTAKRDARFKLGAIKGKTEINGQGRIGIIGVENPYVTGTSENMLPPFYEWNNTSGGGAYYKFHDPYVIEQYSKDAANHANSVIHIPVIPGQTYSLNADITKNPANIPDALFFYWLDADGNRLAGEGTDTRKYKGTYTVPSNARFMQMYVVMEIINDSTAYKTQIVSKPMLTIGSTPKPFKPQKNSLLAFQTELHANPTDGSESDELFERDGQYFKLVKWKKRALDGSENWIHIGNKSGFKSLGVNSYALDAKKGDYEATLLATKFNGQKLKAGNSTDLSAEADIIYIYDGGLRISVANTDSGWGDNYTPTADEVKAYFMGWKMYDTSGSTTSAYNRTDGQYKGWVRRRASDGSFVDGTGTLPTTMAPEYSPYNLLYKLASPLVEPVTSEGCLTLTEGDNQIEVGTGIILREGVKAKNDDGPTYWYLNAINGQGYDSPFKYKVELIKAIYKNSMLDTSHWVLRPNNQSYYGGFGAYALNSNFDQSAAYSVTYIKLDKSPIVPITGSLAANERAQLTDLTVGIQEALQRVSVVEMKKAEKDAVPEIITPTLLNGWVPYQESDRIKYFKDQNGFVHIQGMVKSGAGGAPVFKLLPGYRPKRTQETITNGNADAPVTASIEINPNGDAVPYGISAPKWLSFDNIRPFLAEQ